MARLAAGTVALVAFPFSDLSRSKLRPALILATVDHDDFVLCQITSNRYADAAAVELEERDFVEGTLRRVSYARPGKLFTAHRSLIRDRVGTLGRGARNRVLDEVVRLLRSQV